MLIIFYCIDVGLNEIILLGSIPQTNLNCFVTTYRLTSLHFTNHQNTSLLYNKNCATIPVKFVLGYRMHLNSIAIATLCPLLIGGKI